MRVNVKQKAASHPVPAVPRCISNPFSISDLNSINWLHGYMAAWVFGSLDIWAAVYRGRSLAPCVDLSLYMLLFLYIAGIVARELSDFLLAAIARLLYVRFDA